MLLSKYLNRKYFTLVVVLALVLVLGVASLKLFQPRVKITIAGQHSPIENSVYVNGARLFPRGENGVEYFGKLKNGDNELELRGPYIQTVRQTVSAGLVGGEKTAELTINPKDINEIVAETFSDPDATLTGTKLFKDSSTIVSYVKNTDISRVYEEGFGVVILKYNKSEYSWVNITEGFTFSQSDFEIGEPATNYIREFGDE